jgi:hypothetical protein
MSDLLRPKDLEKIVEDKEMTEAREELDQMKREKDQAAALQEAFMSRELHPEVKERVNAVVSRAAQMGNREVMAVSFPASYCNDGGRRINNALEDWPSSLEGFAKVALEYYEKELKPLGYRLEARILNYPGGMPGDVGLFLCW